MSLGSQIEKLGIPLKDLANLGELNLVILEFKVREKLDLLDTLSEKDIVRFMYTVKKEKHHIQVLFQQEFSGLLAIIEHKGALFSPEEPHKGKFVFEDDFIRFLAENFEHYFKAYTERCLRLDNYHGLYALMRYSAVLSSDLLRLLYEQLGEKLSELLEGAQKKSPEFEKETACAVNPFFFRCFNEIRTIQFEYDIEKLLNLVLEQTENEAWCLRICFALGAFNARNYHTKCILEENRNIALRAGVVEEGYLEKENKPKGGTKYNEASKTWPTMAILFPVLVMCIVLVVLGLVSRFAPDSNEFPNELYSAPVMEELVAFSDREMVKQIKFLHSDTVEIIEQNDITFNIENSLFPIQEVTTDISRQIEIKNDTKRELFLSVFYLATFNFVYACLAPNQSIMVDELLTGIRIYAGEQAQIIDYVAPNGDTLSHFRFNEFSENDQRNFDVFHHLNAITNRHDKIHFTITNVNNNFVVERD